MNIYELADIIGCDILIRRYANQNNRFVADFEHCGVKENKHDNILSSSYGEGKTASEALENYAKKIKGKWLVINAGTENRKEIGVPETITI